MTSKAFKVAGEAPADCVPCAAVKGRYCFYCKGAKTIEYEAVST